MNLRKLIEERAKVAITDRKELHEKVFMTKYIEYEPVVFSRTVDVNKVLAEAKYLTEFLSEDYCADCIFDMATDIIIEADIYCEDYNRFFGTKLLPDLFRKGVRITVINER